MHDTQPNHAPEPRKPMIARACDFIDLQAGFVRVDRTRAQQILTGWSRVDELTHHEVVSILNRYDPASL